MAGFPWELLRSLLGGRVRVKDGETGAPEAGGWREILCVSGLGRLVRLCFCAGVNTCRWDSASGDWRNGLGVDSKGLMGGGGTPDKEGCWAAGMCGVLGWGRERLGDGRNFSGRPWEVGLARCHSSHWPILNYLGVYRACFLAPGC